MWFVTLFLSRTHCPFACDIPVRSWIRIYIPDWPSGDYYHAVDYVFAQRPRRESKFINFEGCPDEI